MLTRSAFSVWRLERACLVPVTAGLVPAGAPGALVLPLVAAGEP